MTKYAIGLDFGTNSVRALIADVATGAEIADSVWNYEHGEAGIVLSAANPDLARQHPADYIKGIEETICEAINRASSETDFSAADIIAIGVDTTGSTPIPVDEDGEPLAFRDEFNDNPDALAWLWKDHTGHAEAILPNAAGPTPRSGTGQNCYGHPALHRTCSVPHTPGWNLPTGFRHCWLEQPILQY